MTGNDLVIRVAVPVPVADTFDYLWSGPEPPPPPGARVRVPLGRRESIGIVIGQSSESRIEPAALKTIIEALEAEPVIDAELRETLHWAADYYHHPLGEVLQHALPVALRKGRPRRPEPERAYRATRAGRLADLDKLARRAPRQAAALAQIREAGDLTETRLRDDGHPTDSLRRLLAHDLIEEAAVPETAALAKPSLAAAAPREKGPELSADQRAAVETIASRESGFATFLLFGVTGSGKTEVFLRLIERELAAGRQTLLLVPEISLTPQLVDRLTRRFGDELVVIHSGLSEGKRLDAWRSAAEGAARLIVGTRSAVFSPLPKAGLIIVDEEHDSSFKQQTGFRYSARDLAIVRARARDIPVILASATPSLETYSNAREGRYIRIDLPQRIGRAGAPTLQIVDMNHHAARQGLSAPLLARLDRHLEAGNQVLLFINRRGFAPVLFCPDCGTTEDCSRCDARMTVHARAGRLRCHHCASERELRWACPACGRERVAVGEGTQRVTDELRMLYPDLEIARLDRDALSRRDSLESILAGIRSGATRIIVGTQLLVKGHDFPAVTLVGVLNADQGLFGTDFRSEERLAQTLIQVSGRAGRADRPGEVIIQTRFPRHPLLESLIEHDYAAFAELALEERRQTGWPPYSHIALWRAESTRRNQVFEFLDRLRDYASDQALAVRVLGPTADSMERRGGRFRGQLLFQSRGRPALHALIDASLAEIGRWRESRRVRWSIDVDPVEL